MISNIFFLGLNLLCQFWRLCNRVTNAILHGCVLKGGGYTEGICAAFLMKLWRSQNGKSSEILLSFIDCLRSMKMNVAVIEKMHCTHAMDKKYTHDSVDVRGFENNTASVHIFDDWHSVRDRWQKAVDAVEFVIRLRKTSIHVNSIVDKFT